MVDIKTRIFHETDKQTIGAEVIVYDDIGNKVNSIMVTDQTQFDQLVEQLRVLDETYVTENQLLKVLSNAQGTINQINATTLNGFKDVDFAMKTHDHDDKYVGIGHAMSTAPGNYLGTGNLFGHVKVIDNLTRGNYVDGEALSARQGKILSDNINTKEPKLTDTGWDSIPLTQTSLDATEYPYCRKYGKLVLLDFHAELHRKFAKSTIVFTLKSEYRPNHTLYGFAYKVGTGDCVTFNLYTNGDLKFNADVANGTKIRINECFFTS